MCWSLSSSFFFFLPRQGRCLLASVRRWLWTVAFSSRKFYCQSYCQSYCLCVDFLGAFRCSIPSWFLPSSTSYISFKGNSSRIWRGGWQAVWWHVRVHVFQRWLRLAWSSMCGANKYSPGQIFSLCSSEQPQVLAWSQRHFFPQQWIGWEIQGRNCDWSCNCKSPQPHRYLHAYTPTPAPHVINIITYGIYKR